MNNLVSIILPTFNSEKTIHSVLKSLHNQTYKNFELIIVDNNSNDSTLKIIQSFKNKFQSIKIINNFKNNLSISLNMGINKAKGEFIMRVDSDDISDKNRIKESLLFLKSSSDIKMIGTNVYLKFLGLKFYKKYPSNHHDIMALMPFYNPFAHPSIIFDKEIFSSGLKYNEYNKYSEDYELWIKIVKKFRVANLKKPLLEYNLSNNQISKIINKEKKDQISKLQRDFLNNMNFNLSSKLLLIKDKLINITSFNQLKEYKINHFLKNLIFIKKFNEENIVDKTFNSKSLEKSLLILFYNNCLYFSHLGFVIFEHYLKFNKSVFKNHKPKLIIIIVFIICLFKIKNIRLKKLIHLKIFNSIY